MSLVQYQSRRMRTGIAESREDEIASFERVTLSSVPCTGRIKIVADLRWAFWLASVQIEACVQTAHENDSN
jgi:hypothetical protein